MSTAQMHGSTTKERASLLNHGTETARPISHEHGTHARLHYPGRATTKGERNAAQSWNINGIRSNIVCNGSLNKKIKKVETLDPVCNLNILISK